MVGERQTYGQAELAGFERGVPNPAHLASRDDRLTRPVGRINLGANTGNTADIAFMASLTRIIDTVAGMTPEQVAAMRAERQQNLGLSLGTPVAGGIQTVAARSVVDLPTPFRTRLDRET